jgi:flagellar motility protein MotE (MotC chaperone)
MPDKEVKESKESPEESPETKAKPKIPLLLIIIAAGIFVIGIGAFSVFMGVFSSTPTGEPGSQPDSTATHAEVAADSTLDTKSEIDLLEEAIFGVKKSVDADDLDELLDVANGQASGISEKDSIEAANWIEAEKAQLAKERAELDAREKKLKAREHQLKQLVSKVSQIESTRITALAKLYEGMKPNRVAPLITKLTDEQAVQILLEMKPASAAKILGVLNSDRAARISANMITLIKEK